MLGELQWPDEVPLLLQAFLWERTDAVRDPSRDEREEVLGKKWDLLLLSKSSHRVQQLEADLSLRSVYRWTNRVADRVLLASVLPSGTSSRSISDEFSNLEKNLFLFLLVLFFQMRNVTTTREEKRTTGALLCGMLSSHVLPREVFFGSFGVDSSWTSSRCADKKKRMSRPAAFSAMVKHKSKENERERAKETRTRAFCTDQRQIRTEKRFLSFTCEPSSTDCHRHTTATIQCIAIPCTFCDI